MMRKRVELHFLVLIVVVLSVFLCGNDDVFAISITDKCAAAKNAYGIEVKDQLETKKNRIIIKAKKGKFRVVVLRDDEADWDNKSNLKKQVKAKMEELGYSAADANFDTSKGNTYVLKEEDLEVYGDEFSILVYSVDKEYCSKYFYNITQVSSSNDESNEPRQTAYIDDLNKGGTPCNWAKAVVNSNEYSADFKKMVQDSMISCFPDGAENVSYNMSESTLTKIQKKLNEFWVGTYKEFVTSGGNKEVVQPPSAAEGWVEVHADKNDDKVTFAQADYNKLNSDNGASNKKFLTCESKNDVTYRKLWYRHTAEYKADYTKGSPDYDKNNGKTICKSICIETLEVIFGPPKAIVAGQCFTYEVEVRSNVKCSHEYNPGGTFPEMKDYIPNEYVPHCNNIAGYYDQGGPSDNFDSCVKSCDGGEYSQECIDKCYKKTDGDTKEVTSEVKTTKTASKKEKLEEYSMNTLALATDGVNPSAADVKKLASMAETGTSEADIKEVYQNVNKYICGEYSGSGSNITYTKGIPSSFNNKINNDGCKKVSDWNKLGYYYFRDRYISTHTVCNLVSSPKNWQKGNLTCSPLNTNKASCSARNGCYRGMIGSYRYIADERGFKRNDSCSDACKWNKKGDSKYYDKRSEAENDYYANLSEYVDKIKSCLNDTNGACKENETSKYTMTVNQKGTTTACENGKGSDCKSWGEKSVTNNSPYYPNDEAKNKSTCIGMTGQKNLTDEIFECHGKCRKYTEGEYMYHTILTFPGAWINNKNGEVSYDKLNEDIRTGYRKYPGNFCTNLNAKNVNADYWTWYHGVKEGKISNDYKTWAGSLKESLVYNIATNVINFGHYKWTFDLGCYYAINKDNPSVFPPSGGGCTNEECPKGGNTNKNEKPSIDNFGTKSITESNLFPKGTSSKNDSPVASRLSYAKKMLDATASEGTRTAGFNWSVDATNLAIKGYPITPTSLIKKIEENTAMDSAKGVYPDNELDYEITLTKDQINKIKGESKNSDVYYTEYKHGTFTDYANSYASLLQKVKVGNSNTRKYSDADIPTFTYYTSNWLGSHTTVKTRSKLGCNNTINGTCDLTLSGSTVEDAKLQDWIKSVN